MEDNKSRTNELQRPWDTFREAPVIEDAQTPWKCIKCLRIISLFLVAIIVFGVATCSKTSFLLLITLAHESTKTLPAEEKPLVLLCIGCCVVAPNVLLCLKSVWKAFYKSSKLPQKKTIAFVLFLEFIVLAAIGILTIVAMPHLDIVTNATILNGVAFFSAVFQAGAHCSSKNVNPFIVPSIFAFIFILLGYALFLALYIMKDPNDVKTIIWVGLAVGASVLVSLNWWENYLRPISENSSSKFLKELFQDMTTCQNTLCIFSTLVRIAVTACVVGAYVHLAQMDWSTVTSIPGREAQIIVIIIGVQLVSSVLCQWFSLAACKMHAVRRCFLVPLCLASPAVMAMIIVPIIIYYWDFKALAAENSNFRSYCNFLDGRILSSNNTVFSLLVWDASQTLCFLDLSKILDIGILTGSAVSWWVGLVLATVHIWKLRLCRIQKTQDLFVRRLYEGAFIEQSLLLNIRFHIPKRKRKHEITNLGPAMIYLCATMWHETNSEMMNIIISIFRLDKYRPKPKEDQISNNLDFTFEAHIYFDDAFEAVKGSNEPQLNEYATSLVKIITDVHGIFKNIKEKFFKMQQQVPDQKVIKTPYGGRLVVTMPQGNNIVVHFKNKDLIRHKKRWSQVMYLYYLLGWKLNTKYYQLWKKGDNEVQIRLNLQKDKQNTYLLALDGDTDFQPAAVMLLADRLKMYPQVGAACGRIHPTGSGPAVWFQKFEYAASHWLQKTAEHVFGSVLCSPGCFSLFRAEALMDDNVMRRYATKSTEAIHYIQYDQGEDRWLCTLMLKQGWRVEYNAASDAYTNAPEDFKELYNQRRRWGPSTMANTVDVLGSASLISKKNSSMSKPFMLYQLFAIISGILAPATICLMIAGSLSFIFNIHSAISLVLAVVPPTIYLGLCFKLKPDTQISIAAVLSIIYAIMMMVVTMSIIGSMVKEQTILTPSSIFITVMSGIYIITGILHPQEVHLLFYGVLYIICIPSAYLLLTIYSMVNMNVVSWGTRETKPAVGAAPTTKQTRTQKGKNKLQELWSKIKCCKKTHSESEDEGSDVERNMIPERQPQNTIVDEVPEDKQREAEMPVDPPSQGWIEQLQKMSSDMRLTDEHLDEEEENFWKELLQRYLYPLPNNKESQEKMHDELRSLRNKITFCFFFLNALWLVSTFVFQVFEVFKISVKIVDLSLEETGGVIEIDPVGLMFILGFALSVLLQFVGMFYHRVNTLIHYIAFLGTEGENKTLNVKEDDTSEDSFHVPEESDSASEFSFATSHYTLSDYDGSDSIYEASSVGTLV